MGVVKTFLLPSYGFSFGYKRKGVSFAPLTEAQKKIVGHRICVPFTSVLVCTSVQTADSRYLSLSRGVLIPFHRDSFAPSPFSARASAIRSRTCGRQRLAFLAASATGGARKPNPSEGAEAAPPQSTDLALLSKFGVNAIPWSEIHPLCLFGLFHKPKRQLPCARGAEKCSHNSAFSRIFHCGRCFL